ncbi:hypothetical protein PVT01_000076700 [Plasmodium vivax]|uniref:VIR protein n=1 Tax=Plasmodium vivax TaxID=5855 RepID=A0A1G4ED86_PLAVI|nr:hypothetical protein PVT01_000076700 [Plasmodium vivax]
MYDIFAKLNPKNTSRPECNKFPSFVHEFNDFVQRINYNESVNFKNKLENFINEIKKYQLATDEECHNTLYHITLLKPDPSVETEVLRSHNPASSSDSQFVIGGERLPHTNALESLESQSPSRIEPAKETFSPKGPLQSTETQDNLVTLHTTEEEQSIEVLKPTGFVSPYREQSTLKAKAKPHEENTQNLMHIKGQYYPELSSHQRVLEFPNIENETVDKGYLRTVRDAVSGFMEGVDPVPVVGVSGGMGALFLLFRVETIQHNYKNQKGKIII